MAAKNVRRARSSKPRPEQPTATNGPGNTAPAGEQPKGGAAPLIDTGDMGLPDGTVMRYKDGKCVGMVWSRDVRVPLRQCDYETPIISRRCPFQADSPEDDVWSLSLAAAVLLSASFFRRFKQWPIHKTRDGIKGHLVVSSAYAELRRTLIEFGYSEKDFEGASWPDIAEILSEGDERRETDELFADIVLGKEKYPCSSEVRDAAKNWALRHGIIRQTKDASGQTEPGQDKTKPREHDGGGATETGGRESRRAKKERKARSSKPGPDQPTTTNSPPAAEQADPLPGGLEMKVWVVPDGYVEKYPYGNCPEILHRLTASEVTAIACEFGTAWGIGKPWIPDNAFWMGPCRFKLVDEYGYRDSDLSSLSVPAICDLFRYSYKRDVRAVIEGSGRAEQARTERGRMRFYKQAAELTRTIEKIGRKVYDLRCCAKVREYSDEQIARFLRALHEYDDGRLEGEYDKRHDPWPFRGGYRLLDLPREQPAAYALVTVCTTLIGGEDTVGEIATGMKVAWPGVSWPGFFGHADILDSYLMDVERDLQERGLLEECASPDVSTAMTGQPQDDCGRSQTGKEKDDDKRKLAQREIGAGESERRQSGQGQAGEMGGKGGRKPTYNVEFCRRVQKTYDEWLAKGIGSKGAWNQAAETHGIKSGDAARVQCRRYLRPNTEQ
ncbi:MAG: hypothetical protein ABFD90_16175 [Phycisphaerales bacterium]